MFDLAGSFAENKDKAKEIREDWILPALRNGEAVVLDYGGVDSTTQSFTHALISEAMRIYGFDVFFDKVTFKDCSESVKKVISIVSEYMQRHL
ncbi:MAG TPA: STAS-like domain-containing protein [Bacteroidota bacterium]